MITIPPKKNSTMPRFSSQPSPKPIPRKNPNETLPKYPAQARVPSLLRHLQRQPNGPYRSGQSEAQHDPCCSWVGPARHDRLSRAQATTLTRHDQGTTQPGRLFYFFICLILYSLFFTNFICVYEFYKFFYFLVFFFNFSIFNIFLFLKFWAKLAVNDLSGQTGSGWHGMSDLWSMLGLQFFFF